MRGYPLKPLIAPLPVSVCRSGQGESENSEKGREVLKFTPFSLFSLFSYLDCPARRTGTGSGAISSFRSFPLIITPVCPARRTRCQGGGAMVRKRAAMLNPVGSSS